MQILSRAAKYAAGIGRELDAAYVVESSIGHMQLGQVYEQLGEPQRAVRPQRRRPSLWRQQQNHFPPGLRVRAHRPHGRGALTIEMLQTVAHERYVPPYATAQIHLGMGQSDQAFDWHNRAFAMRDVHLAFLPNDVKWDPLRSDPRFGTLLERCGFVAR